jgi:hypothetical protein
VPAQVDETVSRLGRGDCTALHCTALLSIESHVIPIYKYVYIYIYMNARRSWPNGPADDYSWPPSSARMNAKYASQPHRKVQNSW